MLPTKEKNERGVNMRKAVEPPFSKLIHLGIVVNDLAKGIEKLKSLGIGSFKNDIDPPKTGILLYRGKPSDEKVNVRTAMIGDKALELLQPIAGESPHMSYFRSKGGGIDHVGFSVEDLDKEKTKLIAQGFTVTNSGKWECVTSSGEKEYGEFTSFDPWVGGFTFELMRVQSTDKDTGKTESPKEKLPFPRLKHIGIVVRDANDAMQHLASVGIGPFEAEVLPSKVECSLYHGKPYKAKVKGYSTRIGDMHLEIHQPIEGDDPHMEFLRTKGEGFDHLGFFVDDIGKETTKFIKRGASLLRSITWEGGGSAYFDINIDGVMVEFVQGWAGLFKKT
jgi:methylmalonyl-CoA/ethylmalonyl-CoA epimerase